MRTCLARIEDIDRHLNAVVALRGDEALAEARRLDTRLAAGESIGPLSGIPVLVKDLEDVEGMRTTQGSLLFADVPPAAEDSVVPARLRAAGAIVVGKTNLPEFATEGYTSNLLFGTTRNPWALDWGPGGSSGGSGAALAAGMAPIATATDGGGSIRIPAAFCGLVGIKPTNGLIGRQPIPDWIDLSTDGPLTTTVADLRLLLGLESGPTTGDPTSPPKIDLSAGNLPTRLLAVPRFIPRGPVSDTVADLFSKALTSAREAFGIAVEFVEPQTIWTDGSPDEDWYVLATAEHVSRLGRAFVEANLNRMHPSARGFMEHGLGVSIDQYLAARRRRFGFVKDMDRLLGSDAVVLTPTVLSQGFLADGRPDESDEHGPLPFDVFNTEVANVTGVPAISLPAGLSPNGVPFGLQIVAPRFRDGLLLELAAIWEQQCGWRRTAPGYESFETALGLTL